MAKKTEGKSSLRKRAEQALREKQFSNIGKVPEADALKLIHELQVHQVELELQNEALMQAHSIAQQAADRYTELYDFSPTGYFTLSQSGLIEGLNLSGANLFGKTRSIVQGQRFENFVSLQSKEIFRQFIQRIENTSVKQTCDEIEVYYLNVRKILYLVGVGDETKKRYLISAVDISELKTVEQKLVVALQKAKASDDLKTSFLQNLQETQQKLRESEQKYRLLAEGIDTPIVMVDATGQLLYVNDSSAAAFGKTRAEMTGVNWMFLLPKAVWEELQNKLRQVLRENEKSVDEIELCVGGESHWYRRSFQPINVNGQPANILMTYIEITTEKNKSIEQEKNRLELEKMVQQRTTELREALKKEQELSEMKGNFVNTTSHEFRTPLTSIDIAAGFIKRFYVNIPVMSDPPTGLRFR